MQTVTLDEDWIPEHFESHIFGCDWCHQAGQTPGSVDEPGGCGISVLGRRSDGRIVCGPLPALPSPMDSTEVIAVKLHFLNTAGPMETQVVNIHQPQVAGDDQMQQFDLVTVTCCSIVRVKQMLFLCLGLLQAPSAFG